MCDTMRDLLGHGFVAADGAQWVHQRKTGSILFTARAMRESMTDNMRRLTVVLLRVLQKSCDQKEEIDILKLMNRFTIEGFAKIGFGFDMNCLESDQDHAFEYAFDNAQRLLARRFLRPTWFWKLQRFFNVGNEAEFKKNIAVIDSTILTIIGESLARRQNRQPPSSVAAGAGGPREQSRDIVSMFLDRFDESTGEIFDPQYLRDIVVNFVLAGRDTTAQTLCWVVYCVTQMPEIANKIRDEIRKFVPELADGRISFPSMEQTQPRVYLEAVIKETLRLHPVVPLLSKVTAKDTVLSDGTFIVKGTRVSIPVYAMGRMTFIWGPDAKVFKPERWIDPETRKIIQISPFQFVSFNAGPRLCLGMNLAMLEMKIVMASVLSRFDIELVPGQEITYDTSLTLAVRGAMMAHITAIPATTATTTMGQAA